MEELKKSIKELYKNLLITEKEAITLLMEQGMDYVIAKQYLNDITH